MCVKECIYSKVGHKCVLPNYIKYVYIFICSIINTTGACTSMDKYSLLSFLYINWYDFVVSWLSSNSKLPFVSASVLNILLFGTLIFPNIVFAIFFSELRIVKWELYGKCGYYCIRTAVWLKFIGSTKWIKSLCFIM